MWAFSFYTNISLFTAFTAGGFIYIATSDLIPEMHKEINIKRSVAELILFLIGIVVMVGLGFFKISIA
jgi:zinc transporter ZupT